jgi:hypothetical protein
MHKNAKTFVIIGLLLGTFLATLDTSGPLQSLSFPQNATASVDTCYNHISNKKNHS